MLKITNTVLIFLALLCMTIVPSTSIKAQESTENSELGKTIKETTEIIREINNPGSTDEGGGVDVPRYEDTNPDIYEDTNPDIEE